VSVRMSADRKRSARPRSRTTLEIVWSAIPRLRLPRVSYHDTAPKAPNGYSFSSLFVNDLYLARSSHSRS
jgi:hypothetical protein